MPDDIDHKKQIRYVCFQHWEYFTHITNSRVFVDYFSFIYQRSNQQLVLTVTTPPLGNDAFSLDYTPAQGFEGAAVLVAHRKACANGNSSQLWRYDPITGFIEAFAADTTNRGMTFYFAQVR